MVDLSLVIPVYNEEELIDGLIRDCCGHFEEAGMSYELLLVDDGSTDESAERIRERLSEKVRLVRLDRNRGKGSAVRRGILAAQGRKIFYTDSDLAYGLDIILEMADRLDLGADLILGSRILADGGYGDYPFIRTIASRFYSWIITVASGIACDTQCGIKGFRRECAFRIFEKVETEGYAFDLEVILLAEKEGMKIEEYPVVIINQGESQVDLLRSSLTMLRDMIRIRKRLR
ncbi:MAG: glycosyltransferase [Firmicutes bacterium]|nr:glycosyltransferase [Bacillota bacterium]